jgi:3D (Asp-Asp-Asp) domain-containing protein
MKKFITYAITAASLAYYACLPFVMAQAANTPIGPFGAASTSAVNGASTGTSAGTTIPQAPTIIETATDTVTAVLSMRVTAYASVPDETDSTPFITADGSRVAPGIAASNILPFGTKIEIPALFGDEIFTIHDRMSTRIKNTIDIWMPTVRQALVFGAEHADIIVLGDSSSSSQSLAVAN